MYQVPNIKPIIIIQPILFHLAGDLTSLLVHTVKYSKDISNTCYGQGSRDGNAAVQHLIDKLNITSSIHLRKLVATLGPGTDDFNQAPSYSPPGKPWNG